MLELASLPIMFINVVRTACVLSILFTGIVVNAQTELIVRLDDAYTGSLKASLENGRAEQGVSARLFQGTMRSKPLYTGRTNAEWIQNTYVLSFRNETERASAINEWGQTPGVLYVQENGTYQLDGVLDDLENEPYADSLTHLIVIRADEAWEQTQGSPNALIAIIDTGLYFDHPDFQGQIWSNPGEIPNNGIDDDNNGLIDDVRGYDFVDRDVSVAEGDFYVRDNDPSEDGNQDHGTLTAGVMSAALGNNEGIAGVAPGATLLPVRAFGRDGVAEDDDIAAAIVYAADQGADAINLSFGRDNDSPILHEAIRYAYSQGTVIVASGGNEGGDAPHYPSDYPEVIGVAWFTADGSDIEGFGGQYGPGIDLGAPGTSIFTTLMPKEGDPRPIEEQLYGRRSGSSLSAPQVTGTVALLRTIDPSLSPESIRGVLTATARDVGEPGWDHETAAGLLDVANALGLPYPSNVSITTPQQDGGTAESSLAVIGSAIAPQFESWTLDFASYDDTLDDPIGEWRSITGPTFVQVRHAELGTWQTGSLPEGMYLLRLSVNLTNGQTIEDRNRVNVDRTPPSLDMKHVGPAYFDGRQGVLVDLESDDVVEATLEVRSGSSVLNPVVTGQERERQHGIYWPNEQHVTGSVEATIRVENAAGLSASVTETVELESLPINTALFSEFVYENVPSGYALERTTDFDSDGLKEIVFNRLVNGEPSDTVLVAEWTGLESGFIEAHNYPVSLIPRDEGDTNGDNRRELLFQFGPNTYVFEAISGASQCADLENQETCYPQTIIFQDETPSNSTRRPFWGARFADLDGDGNGEIIGHDLRLRTPDGEVPETMWRIFERDGDEFVQIAELENQTSNSDPDEPVNSFNSSSGLIGDFDGDGRKEWVVGDYDGDYMVYEALANNQFHNSWTFETDRYEAGRRLTQGDFDGDGREEFWGMTIPKIAGGIEGGAYGLAQQFSSTGNDSYELAATVAFQGLATTYGTMTAADFNGDGIDELVVVHPPDVWVLSALDDWKPIFHAGAIAGEDGPSGYRSIRVVVEDFTGDSVPELVVSGADGQMRLFQYNSAQQTTPPPVWRNAYAIDASTVQLSWNASADSVSVYSALPGSAYSLVATTDDNQIMYSTSEAMQYALRGWYEGMQSDLNPPRVIRPHDPAIVEQVEYPSIHRVGLRFSEQIAHNTTAEQFILNGTNAAQSLFFQNGNTGLILEFDTLPAGAGVIAWNDIFDTEGTPVGQSQVEIDVPSTLEEGELLISSWEILTESQVVLVFNKSLAPGPAEDLSNYSVDPAGTIDQALLGGSDQNEMTLTISGRVLGATGLATTIIVSGLTSTDGSQLAPEGNVATLSAFANDLSDVYVFPNPYRQATSTTQRVIIAGLPREATVEVFSLGGEHVRSLEEFDGDGGTPWDLTDSNGELVPSGIYILRIEAENLDPVIEKVAVIR